MALESIWRELADDTSAASGVTRRRIEKHAACDIFLAMAKPKNTLMMQVEVPAALLAPGITLPRSRGFDVHVNPLTPGPRGQIQLTLQHARPEFPEIFETLCSDVVAHMACAPSAQAAVRAFLARLTIWQHFLERHSEGGLGPESQIGLYGELWLMKHHLICEFEPEVAVAAWTGPSGANQDFQISGVAIEVKTTRANSHQSMRISSVRQLDDVGVRTLMLFQLSLDSRLGDDATLTGQVGELRDLLNDSPAALIAFNDKLTEAGYLDIHAHLYANTSYAHRGHHFFHVTEGFPRILERDLREGVGDVLYSIALAQCLPFSIEDADALTHLRDSIEV